MDENHLRPARSPHRPWDQVLEAAESGGPLALVLVGAPMVRLADLHPTPRAPGIHRFESIDSSP